MSPLRTSEITTLLPNSTNVVASPMPNEFLALLDTARVGHIPSIRIKTGFSFQMPFQNS